MICTCCPIHSKKSFPEKPQKLDRNSPMPAWCREELRKMTLRKWSRSHDTAINISELDKKFSEQVDLCELRGQSRHLEVNIWLENNRRK